MTLLGKLQDRARGGLQATGSGYADGADRPLRGYATTMAVYAALVGMGAAGVRLSGRDIPDGLSAADIALSAIATHKLSRLLARDPVTSPLRAPFTSYRGAAGPAEVAEEVRGTGGRKAVGELVTCPFCTGMWIATAMTAGLIYLAADHPPDRRHPHRPLRLGPAAIRPHPAGQGDEVTWLAAGARNCGWPSAC